MDRSAASALFLYLPLVLVGGAIAYWVLRASLLRRGTDADAQGSSAESDDGAVDPSPPTISSQVFTASFGRVPDPNPAASKPADDSKT